MHLSQRYARKRTFTFSFPVTLTFGPQICLPSFLHSWSCFPKFDISTAVQFRKNRRHWTDEQRDGVQHLIRPARESRIINCHSMSCPKQAELQHKPNNIQRTLSLSCVMKLDNACMLLTATQLWRFQWLTSRRNIEWSHLVERFFCVLATFFTLSVLKLAIQPLRGAFLQSAHSEVFKIKFNSKKY